MSRNRNGNCYLHIRLLCSLVTRNRNQSHQHNNNATDPIHPNEPEPKLNETKPNQSNPITQCNFLLIVNIFNDGSRQSNTGHWTHHTTGHSKRGCSSINFNQAVGGGSAGSSGSNASNVGSTTAGTATGSSTSTAVVASAVNSAASASASAAGTAVSAADAHQFTAATSVGGVVGGSSKWSPNGNVSNRMHWLRSGFSVGSNRTPTFAFKRDVS